MNRNVDCLAKWREQRARCHGDPVTALAWLRSIDSTNAQVLRTCTELPDRAALVADTQTAGRGRRGRGWCSPPESNLYLSLFARTRTGLPALGPVSLIAGLCVAFALREAGVTEVALKWPNDLFARGRKLGGLLIEGNGRDWVLGLGLNIAMPQDSGAHIDQPWIDLAELDAPTDRPFWAARASVALERAVGDCENGLAAAWLQRFSEFDALRDRAIEVRDRERQHRGHMLGVAADGALRLRAESGEVRHFHSGDVQVRAQ